jgi:HSP20 family protein
MERGGVGEQYHRVERSYGKFVRRFRLPSHIDRASVGAAYENGVLTISLAKKEDAGKKPIHVAIR